MYEPLNVSLASLLNCIRTHQKEIKLIDQAIGKMHLWYESKCTTILKSIPGVGPVWTSGRIAEIGNISVFHFSDALAKYAGLTWKKPN